LFFRAPKTKKKRTVPTVKTLFLSMLNRMKYHGLNGKKHYMIRLLHLNNT